MTAENLGNTTFLMAEGLEHCKTRVLEGSRMEFGGGGVAGSGAWENTHLAVKHGVLLRF